MGNRAVITTLHNYNNDGVGVYLHWNGGRDSVEAFLEYMKLKRYRTPDTDCYGWARLCQVIGNFFGGTTSIGIDTVNNLDIHNGDNGVYIINGWDIVGRLHFDGGVEQSEYEMDYMLKAIDESQPPDERLGSDFFDAEMVPTESLLVGDEVFVFGYDGKPQKHTIIGYGDGSLINGYNLKGIPYTDMYAGFTGIFGANINNYLREKSYRLSKRAEILGIQSLLSERT